MARRFHLMCHQKLSSTLWPMVVPIFLNIDITACFFFYFRWEIICVRRQSFGVQYAECRWWRFTHFESLPFYDYCLPSLPSAFAMFLGEHILLNTILKRKQRQRRFRRRIRFDVVAEVGRINKSCKSIYLKTQVQNRSSR